VEVVADGPFRGEVVGQGVPGAAVVQAIEDGIDDRAQVGGARCPGGQGCGEEGLQEGPLWVGEVAGVGLARGRGFHAGFSQETGEAEGCPGMVFP
jgi:hypothetical protein